MRVGGRDKGQVSFGDERKYFRGYKGIRDKGMGMGTTTVTWAWRFGGGECGWVGYGVLRGVGYHDLFLFSISGILGIAAY